MSAGLLREIRAELHARGLERLPTRRVLAELGVHVALLALGLAVFFCGELAGLRAAGLALALLGHLGVTTNAHTWSHRAGSASRRFDDALAFLTGGFVSGISFVFWHDKHNRRHHGAPNVAGVDPDHDFWPFLALTEAERARAGAGLRAWHRVQWLVFPLLLALMIPRMKLEGVGFALRRARARESDAGLARLDLAVLAASYGAWWGLPLALGTLADALVLNVAREVFLSYALFAIFAPAHLPREAAVLARRVEGDFALQQTATSLDYRVGRLAGFFLSGLQYQIEHHLVPGLAHPRYAELEPIVRRACARHGYPHRVLGWGEALRHALAVIRTPKPVVEPRAPVLEGGAR